MASNPYNSWANEGNAPSNVQGLAAYRLAEKHVHELETVKNLLLAILNTLDEFGDRLDSIDDAVDVLLAVAEDDL